MIFVFEISQEQNTSFARVIDLACIQSIIWRYFKCNL